MERLLRLKRGSEASADVPKTLSLAPLNRVLHELRGRPKIQLLLNMRPVRLNCLDTEMQFLRNLARPMPLADQPENLQFPVA